MFEQLSPGDYFPSPILLKYYIKSPAKAGCARTTDLIVYWI